MTYRFLPGRMYRMPTHFGPAPGPRQIPDEARADPTRSPHKTLVAASPVTLTPAENSGVTVERRQVGHGAVRFHRAEWAQLPTMYHVVNALADLPVVKMRGGSLTVSRGGKPYLDQRVLS